MKANDTIESQVRNLLSEVTLNQEYLSAPRQEKLTRRGMDSIGIIEFLAVLQDRFAIQLEDEEMVPENFESIQSVTSLLVKKNGTI